MPNKVTTKRSELTASGLPLRDFWGDFKSFDTEMDGIKLMSLLNLDNLEILKSEGDYPYPTAQIRIENKPGDRTTWGRLLNSPTLIALGIDDIVDLEGKRVRFTAKEESFTPPDASEAVTFITWLVTGVEGAKESSSDSVQVLVDLADGKTRTAFAETAFKTPEGKADSEALFDGSLIDGLISAGKLTESKSGVLKKV